MWLVHGAPSLQMKLVDERLQWEMSAATATATATRDSPSALHKSSFNILREESALAAGSYDGRHSSEVVTNKLVKAKDQGS